MLYLNSSWMEFRIEQILTIVPFELLDLPLAKFPFPFSSRVVPRTSLPRLERFNIISIMPTFRASAHQTGPLDGRQQESVPGIRPGSSWSRRCKPVSILGVAGRAKMNYSFCGKFRLFSRFFQKGGASSFHCVVPSTPRVANNNNSKNITNRPRERTLTVGLWIYEWICLGLLPSIVLFHKGKQPTLMGSIRREKLSKQ